MSDEIQQITSTQGTTPGKDGGKSGQSSPSNSPDLRGTFSLSPGGATTGLPSSPAMVHINTEAKVQHTLLANILPDMSHILRLSFLPLFYQQARYLDLLQIYQLSPTIRSSSSRRAVVDMPAQPHDSMYTAQCQYSASCDVH